MNIYQLEKVLRSEGWDVDDVINILDKIGAPLEEACIKYLEKKSYVVTIIDEVWRK
jgi:hypothetical protein